MKNILIHGFGKVGVELAALIERSEAYHLSGIVDQNAPEANFSDITEVENLDTVDVIIDFTGANGFQAIINHISVAASKPVIISGSSGWKSDEAQIIKQIKKAGLTVLYGANFSVGTALFIELAGVAARLYDKAGEYDVAVSEIHHRQKIDMPSGTAFAIADRIISESSSKDEVLLGTDAQSVAENQLHVASIRVGAHMGGHDVIFDSPADVIKLSQETRTREVYASGSLLAADWLIEQQKTGYYTFQEFIHSYFINQ